jgi:hypothetical protein
LDCIAKKQTTHNVALAVLTEYTENRHFLQLILLVSTSARQRQQTMLVDFVATLDIVSKDFVTRMELELRKQSTKTHVRLANGHRVASPKACGCITFTLAQHDFVRVFHVLRDLRASNIVSGLPWLDGEQATLKFDYRAFFTLLDGIAVETKVSVGSTTRISSHVIYQSP